MTQNFKVFETEIGGRKVLVETGKYAEQANGSCVVRCGDTVVMVNVTMSETPERAWTSSLCRSISKRKCMR